MGFIRVLFSSPKRIAQTLTVFLAILAVPVTLVLVQQQQDLRQRAAEPIPVTAGDYNADGNIKPGPPGTEAVFDPTKGGWVYVPITADNGSGTNPPTDIPFDCGGQNGCICYSEGECTSGYCKRTTNDDPNSLSPGTCDTRPTVDPCTQDTGRSNDCACTTDPQCRSSFCDITSGAQSGTCKTLQTVDSNISSDQIKITLTKGSAPAANIALSLKIALKDIQGGSISEFTKTTDADGKATFDIPNSLSTSLCRDKGLSSTYCRYLERYFTRYFKLQLTITSSNIVFSDTNTNVKEISMTSNGNFPTDPLTFQITDNNPTPTDSPAQYLCDFDGQDGPDLKDYTIWLNEFKNGSTEKKSDCDRNGIIDIFDYAMWLGEFRKKNASQ